MPDAQDPLPALPVSRLGKSSIIGLGLALLAAGIALTVIRLTRPKLPTPKVHRATATKCDASVRTRQRDPSLGGCKSDAECRSGSNGHCERRMAGHARFENRCVYDACSTDDDCKKEDEDPLSTRLGSGPCICGAEGAVNTCHVGNCKTDADCGSGGFCSPSRDIDCGYEGTLGYFCHTSNDECVDDSDCADAGKRSVECRFDPQAERWRCASTQCHYY